MDVFRVENTVPDNTNDFIQQFIGSNDFDQTLRKRICYELDLDVRQDSTEAHLSSQIAEYIIEARGQAITASTQTIIEQIPRRPRKYVAFRFGKVGKRPILKNARELIVLRGEPTWYGPVQLPEDNTASWYIRPLFFRFEQVIKRLAETPDTDTEYEIVTKEYQIRWLCLARVTNNLISLHWSNFTTEKGALFLESDKTYTGRFPYWDHVPGIFDEIIKLTNSSLRDIRLENLILNRIWDKYREDDQYEWIDIRVRAEHRGVSLNASAGATSTIVSYQSYQIEEDENEDQSSIDIQGINYLATTIRKAIENRLIKRHKIELPEPNRFDEEILRTLIRRYNPKSYEYQINDKQDSTMVSGMHVFFGKRPRISTSDRFVHIGLRNIRELSAIAQIDFLMTHFDESKHLDDILYDSGA